MQLGIFQCYGQLKKMSKMKKFMLFSWLLMTAFTNGQSTTYHPFPEGNATWNYIYFQQFMSMPPNDYELVNYSYTFSGDTLINNLTYHKLITPFPNAYVVGYGYRGAIRQDIVEKKVFFIPPTEISERVLYDFTMQVGDTVKGVPYYSPRDTVQSIDSVLIGNIFRKRWLIHDNYYIIEGIGSTCELLGIVPVAYTDGPEYNLSCYSENNKTLYPDSQTNCELINSLKFLETNSTEIKVYPNSQKGSFTIEFVDANILEIKLIDMLGKVIFQRPTNNMKTIIIERLQSGLYVLIGKNTNNKLITKKLISCP